MGCDGSTGYVCRTAFMGCASSTSRSSCASCTSCTGRAMHTGCTSCKRCARDDSCTRATSVTSCGRSCGRRAIGCGQRNVRSGNTLSLSAAMAAYAGCHIGMRRGERLEAVSRLSGFLGHRQHVPVRNEGSLRWVKPIHNQELPEKPEARVFSAMPGYSEHRIGISESFLR